MRADRSERRSLPSMLTCDVTVVFDMDVLKFFVSLFRPSTFLRISSVRSSCFPHDSRFFTAQLAQFFVITACSS